MSLYSVRTHPAGYTITKLTDDLEPESSYTLAQLADGSEYSCDCPAGKRHTCRHRIMLPHFIATDRVNSPWLYQYDDVGHSNWRRFDFDEPEVKEVESQPVDDGIVRRKLK